MKYREIPENERRSFLSKEEAWAWMQEQQREASKGTLRKVAEIVAETTADAIVNAVQYGRDKTRKQ
jgi:hypothetical protein